MRSTGIIGTALRAALSGLVGFGLLGSAGAGAQPAPVPTAVEVRAGDTFSGIAAQLTGIQPRLWRQLYDPQLSNLPDPNVVQIGMRLELVTEASGARYLRVAGPARVARLAAPAPAAVAGTSPAPVDPAAVLPVAAAPETDLIVGILPNIPAPTLLAQYEALKRYLERLDGHKVRLVVPANFKAFFDSTMRGEYDLAVSAPHLARVAQLDRGMVPVGMYEPRIGALLVAPLDSPIAAAGDLRGKAVAFANPQSLVAMYGQQWLRQKGLEAGKDYEVKGARSDLGVGRMVLVGEAAAVILSNGEFRSLPPDESAKLRVVETFARFPNFILLANPRLERERIGRLHTQLKEFLADKDDGVAFAQATGLTGIVDVDEAVQHELDAFAAATRRSMGYGQ
jgi:phosphonate transport system substrate-binding protein